MVDKHLKQLAKTLDPTLRTVDLAKLEEKTDNLYEALVIISKRANQISSNLKEELSSKLSEFNQTASDNLEEVTENREQIEISKSYERMPHPTVMATREFLDDKVYHRNPAKEAPTKEEKK